MRSYLMGAVFIATSLMAACDDNLTFGPEAKNIEIVRRLFAEGFSGGNLQVIDEIIARDFVLEDPNLPSGVEGLKAIVKKNNSTFNGWKIEIDDISANDNQVFVRWTGSGVHANSFMSETPTGRNIELTGISIYELKDGKIVADWVQPDNLGLLTQLGIVKPLTMVEEAAISLTPYDSDDFGYEVYRGAEHAFMPNSAVLFGPTEAVLIDAQFLLSDAEKLSRLIDQTGRKLTTILITHAHPDHVWGVPLLKKRYPNIKVYARAGVLKEINAHFTAKRLRWQGIFPGDIPGEVPMIEELKTTVTIDGQPIQFHDLPLAETPAATAYYFEPLNIVVTGDLIFNEMHMYLADTNAPLHWIKAINGLADVFPDVATVIPGHGDPAGKELYAENIAYLEAYTDIAKPFVTQLEIAKKMVELFPDHKKRLVLALAIGPAVSDPNVAEWLAKQGAGN